MENKQAIVMVAPEWGSTAIDYDYDPTWHAYSVGDLVTITGSSDIGYECEREGDDFRQVLDAEQLWLEE